MKSRYFVLGQDIAEREIQTHEASEQRVQFKDYTSQDLEIKPFTVKAHAYEIEALDHIASKLGTNRSGFVQSLFLDFMVVAAADFVVGYQSIFSEQKSLRESLSDYLDLDNSELSPAAKNLLDIIVDEVCKDA